jgi:hypothetical protein
MPTITATFGIKIDPSYVPDTILELVNFSAINFTLYNTTACYLDQLTAQINISSFNIGKIPNLTGDESAIEEALAVASAENSSMKLGLRILEKKLGGDWLEIAEFILLNYGRKDYLDLRTRTGYPSKIIEKTSLLGVQLIDYGDGLLWDTDLIVLNAACTIEVTMMDDLSAVKARVGTLELAFNSSFTGLPALSLLGRTTTSGPVETIPQSTFQLSPIQDLDIPLSIARTSAIATNLAFKADLIAGIVPDVQLPIYSTLLLGETSLTAYRGDNGLIAFNHVFAINNPHNITALQVGLGNVNNTTDALKPISSATQTALNLKANTANPTFTGTVSGITATMVGLGNANNTTDALKPVSSATQTALNLKANLISPILVSPLLGTPTSGVLTNITGLPLTTGVIGVLPISNGGTNSATQNWVDLTTIQSVAGAKTFSAITYFTSATPSTSTITGGAVVSGGLGVGGAVYAGGIVSGLNYQIGALQVVGARQAGWVAGTGTPNKAAFADTTATLLTTAQRVLAIEQCLRLHGLIN